jgi:hypothetical protein
MNSSLVVIFLALPLAAQNCLLTDDPGLTVDQSASLQHCLDSAADYSTVLISTSGKPGSMPHVRLDRTVKLNGRYTLSVECPGGHFLGPTNAPGFYWGGVDGGTMVNASGSSGLRLFQHCNFFSGLPRNAGSTGGANILIDIDTSKTVGSSVTTTDDTLDDLGLTANGMNPSFVGIRFSASGDANVEAMRVTNSRIQCSTTTDWNATVGIGIYIAGYTFDALRHRYSDNKFLYCAQGIRGLYGLPDIGPTNHFQSNRVCITALATPLRVHDNDAENCGQFFVGGGEGIIIESNRIAACRPAANQSCISVHGSLISRGNLFNALIGIPIAATAGTQLLSEGDSFPDYKLFLAGAKTFYQFEAKLLGYSFGISVMGGNQSVVFSCNHNNQLPAQGAFVLCADGYLNKLQLSEHGGTFKNVP